jgi:hypothetical protein
MDMATMVTRVRQDLMDEDSADYSFTDEELERHISRAVKDFSQEVPKPERAEIATTGGQRTVDLSSLTDRVMVESVEYPEGLYPQRFRMFRTWGETLTILGSEIPDGSNCAVYYGKLHTLDESGSTIPARCEELIAEGAAGYAALAWEAYAINRVNAGGEDVNRDWESLGKARLEHFRSELKRMSWKNRVRIRRMYTAE